MKSSTSSDKFAFDSHISEIIEAIIKRGNDVEIRKRSNGYIVLEVKKTIRYSTRRIVVE